ncbi:MAG: 30S ribosomal protein S17 [Acidipila sp.]|nr:30S ribosomal protein S17 [Acidipila sp.]
MENEAAKNASKHDAGKHEAGKHDAGQKPERHQRQTKVGFVTSAKMQKTIVVKVTRTVQHNLYKRTMRITKKFYAHDENGEARTGDKVRIVETRPLSKLKRWRLAEIVARSARA